MSAKIVLITGALTGIGRATAFAFAKADSNLVVAGRHDEAGIALAKELFALGAAAEFVRADVRYDEDVRNLVDKAVTRFGRLDVAVNNAGTEGKPGPVTEQTSDSYAAMFDTNVLGTLLSLKHELRVMQPQGSGSIVNISSTMGERGAANLSLYTASKHAVEGLTKSAALEGAAFGVRVNAVAPGPTDPPCSTGLTGAPDKKAAFIAAIPLKRGAKAEEIADAIVFLASSKASFITGQIMIQRRHDRELNQPFIGRSTMTDYTHQTAPTRFVEANGIRFAYRRFGRPNGIPLLFNQHFTGTMDHWDPAVTDGMAKTRKVILFDNAGVGSSSGEAPRTFAMMGTNAIAFIRALDLTEVDVLGLSIGGFVAQEIALQAPELVRRLILLATGPRSAEGMVGGTPEGNRNLQC